jgi:hypothetical protein
LREQHPLFHPKPKSLREAGLVAVVKPCRQSLCGGVQGHVARNVNEYNPAPASRLDARCRIVFAIARRVQTDG